MMKCVPVALISDHSKRMRCVILSSLACLDVPYFSTARFSEKKIIDHNVRVLVFSTTVV